MSRPTLAWSLAALTLLGAADAALAARTGGSWRRAETSGEALAQTFYESAVRKGKEGLYGQAAALMERAVEKNGSNEKYRYYLSLLLYKRGDFGEAQQHLGHLQRGRKERYRKKAAALSRRIDRILKGEVELVEPVRRRGAPEPGSYATLEVLPSDAYVNVAERAARINAGTGAPVREVHGATLRPSEYRNWRDRREQMAMRATPAPERSAPAPAAMAESPEVPVPEPAPTKPEPEAATRPEPAATTAPEPEPADEPLPEEAWASEDAWASPEPEPEPVAAKPKPAPSEPRPAPSKPKPAPAKPKPSKPKPEPEEPEPAADPFADEFAEDAFAEAFEEDAPPEDNPFMEEPEPAEEPKPAPEPEPEPVDDAFDEFSADAFENVLEDTDSGSPAEPEEESGGFDEDAFGEFDEDAFEEF